MKRRIERYFGIDRGAARQLISAARRVKHTKSGSNKTYATKVTLLEAHAVLKMKNITLRNAVVPDKDLTYLERLADTLMALHAQGVQVVPILAFRSDGYILQPRAQGAELFENERLGDKGYVLERTALLANAPQAHYDAFVADTIAIADAGVLIDFRGKDNFFYHESTGFHFVDLNAHNDFVYGLADEKPCGKHIAAWNCFLPCCYDAVPAYRDTITGLLAALTDAQRADLRRHNKQIFVKCRYALLSNGVSEDQIDEIIADERFIPQKQQLELI